jgi:hypothetical protein
MQFNYFLKLSNISLAISLPHNQKAKPHANASIEINHINIISVIFVLIHIFHNTTIKVKNSIIIFHQLATILAVFCSLRLSA